jgi:hypothetical protein
MLRKFCKHKEAWNTGKEESATEMVNIMVIKIPLIKMFL